MKKIFIIPLITALFCSISSNAQNEAKGYYKDVFVDGGIFLNSFEDLPSARYLGLCWESFASAENEKLTMMDTILQNQLICGSPYDENGILLYPDNSPRFRVVYMNGGKATNHGRSLTEKGRENYNIFIQNGGSYVGTCAGAYLASKGVMNDTVKPIDNYLGIWPGVTRATKLLKSYTNIDIEPGSPLLKYFSFGEDMQIDSVRHNGGCFAYTKEEWPAKTEILARYDSDTVKVEREINGEPVVWAYKDNDLTGRVVACGSHPEEMVRGERLDLMSAMILYAMDGNGNIRLKAELENGKPRTMDASTSDNNPGYAKIGDKQYHHFTIDIPKKCEKVTITLNDVNGAENFDLFLFAASGEYAFADNAKYKDIAFGVAKILEIENPQEGKLYISVFCDTTVDTTETAYGTQYSGRVDVLNGVPYSITVKY